MAYYGVGVTYSMGNDGGHGELPYDLQAHPVPGAAWFRTAGADSTPGGGQGGARENSWTHVTTVAEARKAVQELVSRNPAIVKIWVDDRADRMPPGKTVAPMPPEISSAIIDEAHKHHLQVAAHITYLKDAKELLRENIDGFGHGVRDVDIDDEYIQLLKQHPNTFFTMALAKPERPRRVQGRRHPLDCRNAASLPGQALARNLSPPATAGSYFSVCRVNRCGNVGSAVP